MTALGELKNRSAGLCIELRKRGDQARSSVAGSEWTVFDDAAECIELLLFALAQYSKPAREGTS